jgi:hypothetical protein
MGGFGMRLHLFEWEDQTWFPASLRAAMTSYLAAAYGITPFPKIWANYLAKLMSGDGVTEIVDLGSGSGGPVGRVVKELVERGFNVRVTLTDLYPNVSGLVFPTDGASSMRYWPEPMDAIRVPPELAGIRTMFGSFHHFRPTAARGILRDAFEQRRPICIFEGTSRTPPAIASALLIPLLVVLLTPVVRPVSPVQILFTYFVPILPLLIFWDGLVSQLRTYSVEELKTLTRDLQSAEYRWEAGLIEIPRMPAGVPYLIGRPVASASPPRD